MEMLLSLELLKSGKKLRHESWDKDYYIKWSGTKIYLYRNDLLVQEYNIFDDSSRFETFKMPDWEEYKPAVRLSDLKAGDKFKLNNNPNIFTLLKCHEGLRVVDKSGPILTWVYIKDNILYGNDQNQEIIKV